MFYKNWPALNDLIQSSKQSFCFIYTTDGDRIPVKDCTLEEEGDKLFIIGYDVLNNRYNKIENLSIESYDSFPDQENIFLKKIIEEFDLIKEVCLAENISNNFLFLYKEIPIYQRIISIRCNKLYSEITLDELKSMWKECILKECLEFENYITGELTNNNDNELYKQELINIQNALATIKLHEELAAFTTKEEVVKFWPKLLQPSPSFVFTQEEPNVRSINN